MLVSPQLADIVGGKPVAALAKVNSFTAAAVVSKRNNSFPLASSKADKSANAQAATAAQKFVKHPAQLFPSSQFIILIVFVLIALLLTL